MDTEDTDVKLENLLSEETDPCDVLQLSTITEIDESSNLGSTVSEEIGDCFMESSSGNTYKSSIETDPSTASEQTNFENFTDFSSCGSQLPTTPSAVLRKRISNLEDLNSYLKNELDELMEFSKLERQVHHGDCISKDKVKSQEDELALVNEKVQQLIEENSKLKNNLEQKDNNLKEIEEQLKKALRFQDAAENIFTIIGNRLGENLEVLEKREHLSENHDNENCQLCLTIKESTNHVRDGVNETNKLMNNFIDFDQNTSENFVTKLIAVENALNTSRSEKTYFEKKCSIAEMKIKEQSKALSVSEDKLQSTIESFEKASSEALKLQKEIESLKDLKTNEELQQSFTYILNELESFINTWENSGKLQDLCDIIQEDKSIITCLNVIMNSNVQSTLFQVFQKLKMQLINYEEEYLRLQTTVESFKKFVSKSESDTNAIKMDVKALNHHVNGTLRNQINELEIKCNANDLENSQLQENLLKMEVESKALKTTLSNVETKLIDTERLLEITNGDKLEIQKELRNCRDVLMGSNLQETFDLYLKQLDELLDTFDHSNNLTHTFKMLKMNTKLFPSLNSLVDSQVQTTFFKVVEKVESVLSMFEGKYDELQKKAEQSNRHVICLEDDVLLLKTKIKNLEQENDGLNGKLQEKSVTKQNTDCDCSEELKTIRELMARELTSLDFEENKEALMNYSSVEIFCKLMQNIIKKEGEISFDLQKSYNKELETKEETVENLNNKIKTHLSWISELESENEKLGKQLTLLKETNQQLEGKTKSLSNNLKLSSSEILSMKSKILQLETENDTLYKKVNVFQELAKTEKSKVVELEELLRKTNIISTLEHNHSLNVLKEQESSIDKEDALFVDKESNYDNCGSKSNTFPTKTPSDNFCGRVRTQCNSPNCNNCSVQVCGIELDHFDNRKCNEFETCLMHDLKNEKALIKDLLIHKMNNEEGLGDQFFTFSDNLFILKDVVQIIGKKIIEMEANQAYKIQRLELNFENKNKELQDLKLSIAEFYSDLTSDNRKLKSDTINSMNKPIFDCGDAISLKKELEFVRNECTSIVDWSRKVGQSSKTGYSLIQNMREEFLSIKEESSNKAFLIDDLYRTVKSEQNKVGMREVEIETLNNEKNNLLVENKLLKCEWHESKVQLGEIASALTHVEIDFPDEIEDICGKIRHLNEGFKRNLERNFNLTEDLNFFISKFHLISLYTHAIEYELVSAQEQNEMLSNELNILKAQLGSTDVQLTENNSFVNQLISKLPHKVSSLNEALEILDHVVNENVSLKGTLVDFLPERQIMQEEACNHLEELKSVTGLNSSLKMELEKCEDCIRNLRSEIRNSRSQYRKKENFTALTSKKLIDSAIQTDALCCKQLNKSLVARNCQVTSLKLQIEEGNHLLKRKVGDLELALSQAKKRIREVKCELEEQKSCNQSLIESYTRPERKYQEESEGQKNTNSTL